MNRDQTNLPTDAIRAALSARNRKMHLSTLERDRGLPTTVLDAFIGRNTTLAPNTLKALAKDLLHGHAEFVPELNALRPAAKPEPRSMGSGPPLIEFKPPSFKWIHHQPGMASPLKPKAKRAGWIE